MKAFTSRRNRGVALLMVLGSLALITVLVVAFLTQTTAELRSAKSFSHGASTRLLADTALNVVMAQIRDGTRGYKDQPKDGNLLAWASQPGAIRTFNQNGDLETLYKLYSDDRMQVDNPDSLEDDLDELKAWESSPAYYTDLNAPVVTGEGGQAVTNYPIVDPAAEGKVEGFEIDDSATPKTARQPAPMPVRWLYVLADGSLAPAPVTAGGNTVTVANCSPQNRVIGRIAFWTDDETCKVNINTAAEGTFWSPPVAGSIDEMMLAANPPLQNEFQRVLGHPATVSLSVPLEDISSTDLEFDPGDPYGSSGRIQSAFTTGLSNLYKLAPRIGQGGSVGGSIPIDDRGFAFSPRANTVNSLMSGITNVTPDSQRLYVSVDEFMMAMDRTDQFNGPFPGVQARNLLRERRFFLTAHSRAPETTLLSSPRISLWPVTWPWTKSIFIKARSKSPKYTPFTTDDPSKPLDQNTWMTPQERLIAHCSTFGGERFFFQRQNPDSSTHDVSAIPRNRDLLMYLRALTDTGLPGYGASVASKWSAVNRDRILASMFDYIRGCVNLFTIADVDAITPKIQSYSYAGVRFRPVPSDDVVLDANRTGGRVIDKNSGAVAPIRLNLGAGEVAGQGSGAAPVLTQLSLLFYATDRREPMPKVPASWTGMAVSEKVGWLSTNFVATNLISATNSQTTKMQMVLVLETRMPSNNRIADAEYWVKASGSPFTVTSPPGTGMKSTMTWPSGTSWVKLWTPDDNFCSPAFSYLYWNQGTSEDHAKYLAKQTGKPDERHWTFASDPVDVSPDAVDFAFDGSTVEFSLHYGNPDKPDTIPSGANPVQTVRVDFGKLNGTYPIPLAPRWIAPGVKHDEGEKATYDASNPPDPTWPGWNPGITAADLERDTAPAKARYQYIDEDPDTTFDGLFSTLWTKRAHMSAHKFTPGSSGKSRVLDDGYYPGWESGGQGKSSMLITPYDVVASMIYSPVSAGKADLRTISQFAEIPSDYWVSFETAFSPPSKYVARYTNLVASTSQRQYHALGWFSPATSDRPVTGAGRNVVFGLFDSTNIVVGASGDWATPGTLGKGQEITPRAPFLLPTSGNVNGPGDWASNYGNEGDGGLVQIADQFFQAIHKDTGNNNEVDYMAIIPFFGDSYGTAGDGGLIQHYFAPNRQIASAVSFGSLPNGSGQGWETLCFTPFPCPAPGSSPSHRDSHPGLNNPRDHAWLDFYTMPVAEPWAISEPASTAGKINLNFQIAPFTYVERSTALRAALKSVRVTAIEKTPETVRYYKSPYYMRTTSGLSSMTSRHKIDRDETVEAFRDRFATNGFFWSASQICDVPLVPEGFTLDNINTFWAVRQLASDTARETPYGAIYPLLTSRSNTYQVHMRVQALKQSPGSAAGGQWVEGTDQVLAEYRGSAILERYIDPNDPRLPDFAVEVANGNWDTANMDQYYRFRVVQTRQFNP